MRSAGLGERLRSLRESATLTREALSERSGVSVRTIAALELGTVARPRVSTLGALADALSVDGEERAVLVRLARTGLDAAPSSAAVVPRELPPVLADLAERDALRARAVRHLRESPASARGPRTWILTGPPGVGKTTLALHVAHEIVGDFPDGQIHLDMEGGRRSPDADPVLSGLRRVLTACGVHPAALPPDVDALAGMMRSRLAQSRILLVLDDAPAGVDLGPLLPSGPAAGLVVTARTHPVTGVDARHDVLAPLEGTAALRMLERLAGNDRLRAEPDAAARVVDLCDRLPVALHVVGSRLAARPSVAVADIADRLSDERSRLDLLSVGDLGVRASLGAAYESLAQADRATLHVIGDLGGASGPTWAVAAALSCELPEAVVRIERLAEAGLVETGGGGAHHRYRVHDLTRLLARERAAQADDDAARGTRLARVLDRWRILADRATGRLPIVVDEVGDIPAPTAAGRLGDTELDAVVGDPMTWFARTVQTMLAQVESALGVCAVERVWPALTILWRYWRTSDVLADAGPVLAEVVRRCSAAGDRRGEAVALNLSGFDPYGRADPAELRRRLHRAGELFAALGEVAGQVRALSLEAVAVDRIHPDDSAPALAIALRAVQLAGANGRPHVIADAVATLARLALGAGRLADAEAAVADGRAVLAGTSVPQWSAQMDWVEGSVRREQGHLEQARDLLLRAHGFVAEVGDRWGMATIERDLGEVLVGLGEVDAGLAVLREARAHAAEIGLEVMADRLDARLAELDV